MIFGYILLCHFLIDGVYMGPATVVPLSPIEVQGINNGTVFITNEMPTSASAVVSTDTDYREDTDGHTTIQTVTPPMPISIETKVRKYIQTAPIITDPMTTLSASAAPAKTSNKRDKNITVPHTDAAGLLERIGRRTLPATIIDVVEGTVSIAGQSAINTVAPTDNGNTMHSVPPIPAAIIPAATVSPERNVGNHRARSLTLLSSKYGLTAAESVDETIRIGSSLPMEAVTRVIAAPILARTVDETSTLSTDVATTMLQNAANQTTDTALPMQAAATRSPPNSHKSFDDTAMPTSTTESAQMNVSQRTNHQNDNNGTAVLMTEPSVQTRLPLKPTKFENRTVPDGNTMVVYAPQTEATVNVIATTTITAAIDAKKNTTTNTTMDEKTKNIAEIIQKDLYVYCTILATTLTMYVLNIITTFLLIKIKFVRTYIINRYWHEVIRLVHQAESR